MATAEELLSTAYLHEHAVIDSDSYFIIDPISRRIENTARKKLVIMQYDHDSERFTFELPRYIEGHDMLQCTSVTVNCDNIEEGTGVTKSDAPDMTDLQINPENPDTVISSWLISRNLTQLAGILSFSIEYKCVDADGNVVYEWSTDIFDDVEVKARKKNGTAAVIEYTDLLEQWRAKIFGAGDSVMANIASEGEAQLAAVISEGETRLAAVTSEGETQVVAIQKESTTQQEAVELKGANTLGSIPEDYTETNNAADKAVRTKATAITCETEGEVITIGDSSNDYIRGLNLYGKSTQFTTTGKNLLKNTANTTTVNGVVYTVNDDGSVYVSGTNTGGNTYLPLSGGFESGAYEIPDWLKTGDTFTISDALLYLYDGSGMVKTVGLNETFTVPDGYVYYGVFILVTAGETVNKLYRPMIRVSSEPSGYEPYTGGIPSPNPEYPQEIVSIENPMVSVYGKNLLVNQYPDVHTAYGVTFTKLSDGGIHIKGTPTAAIYYNLDFYTNRTPILHKGLPVTFSLVMTKQIVGVRMLPGYFKSDGTHANSIKYVEVGMTQDGIYRPEYTSVYPDDATDYRTFIGLPTEVSGEIDTIVYPMIRLAEFIDPSFDVYKNQPITISQTLPGIPVTSGGNYTDSNGQQWICDEVDLERGVHIHRIGEQVFTASDGAFMGSDNYIYVPMMYPSVYGYKLFCTHIPSENIVMNGWGTSAKFSGYASVNEWNTFVENNEVKLLSIRKTMEETPLTAEEIEAYKSLKTNYPNTTILNDAGAHMAIKYNADTKTWIRNLIDERITSAIANL